MNLSKRNFLIGATATLGIIAAPAIVRCESLMAIKAIENTRYLTFLEIIYPGMNPNYSVQEYDPRFYAKYCEDRYVNPSLAVKPHMFDVSLFATDSKFLCNRMVTPV